MLLSSIPINQAGHDCVYIDGTIIVSGGDRGQSDIHDTIFLYIVSSDNWITSITHLTEPITRHMLGVVLPY